MFDNDAANAMQVDDGPMESVCHFWKNLHFNAFFLRNPDSSESIRIEDAIDAAASIEK